MPSPGSILGSGAPIVLLCQFLDSSRLRSRLQLRALSTLFMLPMDLRLAHGSSFPAVLTKTSSKSRQRNLSIFRIKTQR
jgi:hypothetical protein